MFLMLATGVCRGELDQRELFKHECSILPAVGNKTPFIHVGGELILTDLLL